jgi:transcriptional regulator with XRE-family HTH domain
MTQRDLAKAAGLTQVTISNIEIGKHEPEDYTKFRLAKALECTVDELFPEDKKDGTRKSQ